MAKHKQQTSINYIYPIAIIGFIAILSFALGNAKLSYDFANQSDIGNFKFYNSKINTSQGGVALSNIKNTGVVFNTSANLSKISWQKTPYLKLQVKPGNIDRKISLFWSPAKNLQKLHQRVVNIPAGNNEVLINTHQNLVWQRTFPWKNWVYQNTAINSFGLLIPKQYNNFTIKKIELLNNLSLWGYAKLIFNELTTDEGVRVNSINAQYGISVLGIHLAYILGIILIISALPLLFKYNSKNLKIFTSITFVCLAIYFIPTLTTLINYAKDSSKISAFHKDKHIEYTSRFGKNFADLAKIFEEKVAKKEKVHFAFSRDYRVRGESNWIAFQYYGIYTISNLDDAKYIFYYHPRDIKFDKNQNVIVYKDKQYKVKVIAQIGNSYILEKIDE